MHTHKTLRMFGEEALKHIHCRLWDIKTGIFTALGKIDKATTEDKENNGAPEIRTRAHRLSALPLEKSP